MRRHRPAAHRGVMTTAPDTILGLDLTIFLVVAASFLVVAASSAIIFETIGLRRWRRDLDYRSRCTTESFLGVLPGPPLDEFVKVAPDEIRSSVERISADCSAYGEVDDALLDQLGAVNGLPGEDYLNFLHEECMTECLRDAELANDGNADAGSGPWAGRPFHVRHGFINDTDEVLSLFTSGVDSPFR